MLRHNCKLLHDLFFKYCYGPHLSLYQRDKSRVVERVGQTNDKQRVQYKVDDNGHGLSHIAFQESSSGQW